MSLNFNTHSKRAERLFEEFLLHHRYFYSHVAEYAEIGPFDLQVELDDGTAVVYDSLNKTVHCMRHGDTVTDEEWRREFSRRLGRALWKKGLTQEELADKIDISRQMINKYITAAAVPSALNLAKIAKELGCSIDSLVEIE